MVGAVHLVTVKIAPDLVEFSHRNPKPARFARQDDGVDCAGRSPTDDREGIGAAFRHQFGQCFEHTDLEGTARATAGQDQSSPDVACIKMFHIITICQIRPASRQIVL